MLQLTSFEQLNIEVERCKADFEILNNSLKSSSLDFLMNLWMSLIFCAVYKCVYGQSISIDMFYFTDNENQIKIEEIKLSDTE